eukprot:6303411-Prymnesium_polylepis.1
MIGLSRRERNELEGLQAGSNAGEDGVHLTQEQVSSRAAVRLAFNPPSEVGLVQRQTARFLLRPYPLGLRFSGKNMSPLPGWLAGAQSVCLNFSPVGGKIDLAVKLHHALFGHSGGFVLKPSGMLFETGEDVTRRLIERR